MCDTQVIIRDHQCGAQHGFFFNKKDKALVSARWEDEDPLLVKLQGQTMFADRRRWCDLDQEQYRLLLALHLSLVADLPDQHQNNPDHPVVKSLMMLLVAFVHLIEQRVGGGIGLVTINRISDNVVTYDLNVCLDDMEFPRPRGGGLKVVVDNSR